MSSKKSRSSRHFRILGYRIRKTWVYGLVGFSVLLPAIFLAIAYALLRSDDNGPRITPVPPAVTQAQNEQPEGELAALLWRYRQASGLAGITGITLHGSYIEDGRHYEMTLSMHAPEMIRKRVRDEAVEVVFVTAGATSQVRTTHAKGESTVRALAEDDLYRYALLLEGAAFRLAERGPEMNENYQLTLGEKTAEGQRIVSKGPAGVSVTHVIDESSGYEVERSAEVWLDGERNILKLRIAELREVEGVVVPHRYHLEINGRERVEIRVQSVQLNPVTPLWFFALEPESRNN